MQPFVRFHRQGNCFRELLERSKRMRLSLRATMLAGGLLWGGAILMVSLLNHARPDYGLSFLQMISSIYPWFHSSHTVEGILVGALDGFVDGALAGLLFAWLYNVFCGLPRHTSRQT
jgi:hypothetical protein